MYQTATNNIVRGVPGEWGAKHSKSWYRDVDEQDQPNEIEFMRKVIYLRDVEPRVQAVTAFKRFSVRAERGPF